MQRIIDKYTLKSANLELKDIDENSRKVAVYLSAFDVMDSDFDIIKKGEDRIHTGSIQYPVFSVQ